MIEKITQYRCNGKIFDEYDNAEKYEKICDDINKVMSQLQPRTQEIEDCHDYNKHNLDILNKTFADFCGVCEKCINGLENLNKKILDGKSDKSNLGAILEQYTDEYPILFETFYRFKCIDFKNGLEFCQPYYVTHQNDAITNIKKYNASKL